MRHRREKQMSSNSPKSKFADLFPIEDRRIAIGRDDTAIVMDDVPEQIELVSLRSFIRSLPLYIPVYDDADD